MKVTKLGHCCLLIEENDTRILTDPGTYSAAQDGLEDIHVVLITHEHADHFHLDSLKRVLEKNPTARVITNKSVGRILEAEEIAYELLEGGQSAIVAGVLIEGFGEKHAPIYESVEPVDNTGYFIADCLFYPGDALTDPKKPIRMLALPMIGPWIKISEAIDYAKRLVPKACFPVHDGILKDPLLVHRLPSVVLPQSDIQFVSLLEGQSCEF
ncbi:MAG TPA: MBL fold metallo-hydrolase [Candidatus Paceibacterota bacterium]|nr:MBL fold metallo-hydrolase [Candidatus Paceibacterota bacterium]